MFYGFFVFFGVFFISEHLYAKNHHTLNANWQSIFVVLINKKYSLQHRNYYVP